MQGIIVRQQQTLRRPLALSWAILSLSPLAMGAELPVCTNLNINLASKVDHRDVGFVLVAGQVA
jgi:hypothetical protein